MGDLLPTVCLSSFSRKEIELKGGLLYFMGNTERINPPSCKPLGRNPWGRGTGTMLLVGETFLRGFLTAISNPLKPKLRSSTYKFRGKTRSEVSVSDS